ncbi:unnamed protein product [Timema podura]|uniref:Bursicon n=1 Tax=Timema podura TaxID=61482 RepID=A0ABN7PAL2_TIMPD|nr:unnamed protein product [Timema podura]
MRVTLQRDQCPVLVPGILCVLWLPLLLATSSVNSGVSDAPMEECQVTPVIHVLQYPGCVPKPIPSFACTGRCSSYVQVSGSKIWQMERSCMCCQESGEREASVSLFCPKAKAGERKFRKMERSCMCCQESGEREASVSLFCPKAKAGERKFRKVTTKAPIDCMCRPCTMVEESAIIPQEIAGYENEGPLRGHFIKSKSTV